MPDNPRPDPHFDSPLNTHPDPLLRLAGGPKPGGSNMRLLQLPEATGRRRTRIRLDAELAAVRAEMRRVDDTASTLLALASVLLGGALVVFAGVDLPAAAGLAWTAVMLGGAAVALLARVVRPSLVGNFGFVRWAHTSSGQDLLDDIAESPDWPLGPLLERAHELRWISQTLHTRYVAIRRAVALLVAGLAAAVLAAAVAVWVG